MRSDNLHYRDLNIANVIPTQVIPSEEPTGAIDSSLDSVATMSIEWTIVVKPSLLVFINWPDKTLCVVIDEWYLPSGHDDDP